ncbi:MAG: energy transducer TonB [Deltaproteobacteria bacterium]|nr:energy transducer TonB [Deltaproteobacteria bacterium]
MSSFAQYGQLNKTANFQLSDRYLQASRLGNIIGFALMLLTVIWLITHPDVFGLPQEAQVAENQPIMVELWEEPPPIEPVVVPEPPALEEIAEPEPVPVPEPEPLPEPVPIPEPEVTPEPVPERILEQIKKPPPPKPKSKPKPKPVPQATAAPAEAAAVPAPPRADPDASRKFISDFIRLVEKSKYYPNEAKRENITGTVKVKVIFNGSGEITGVSLVSGNYNPILGQAAISTLNKVKGRWRARAGAPNSLVVPINFVLR